MANCEKCGEPLAFGVPWNTETPVFCQDCAIKVSWPKKPLQGPGFYMAVLDGWFQYVKVSYWQGKLVAGLRGRGKNASWIEVDEFDCFYYKPEELPTLPTGVRQ